MEPGMKKFEIDFLPDFSDQTLIDELLRIAKVLVKDSLSRRDIDQHGRLNSDTIIARFGSLRQGLQAAGLRPTKFTKASEKELLDIMEEVWVSSLERFGRRPQIQDLKTFGFPVSHDTFTRRFGSWRKALIATAERADRERPTVLEESSGANRDVRAATPRRAGLSIRKRFFVLKRDHYRCCLCKATGVPLEVDHRVPVARGGSDALDNLQALCLPCNRGKRDSFE